jgi:hypothetical protein
VKRRIAGVALSQRDEELLTEALEVLHGHRGEAARLYLMEYVAIWKKACSLRRGVVSATPSEEQSDQEPVTERGKKKNRAGEAPRRDHDRHP